MGTWADKDDQRAPGHWPLTLCLHWRVHRASGISCRILPTSWISTEVLWHPLTMSMLPSRLNEQPAWSRGAHDEMVRSDMDRQDPPASGRLSAYTNVDSSVLKANR